MSEVKFGTDGARGEYGEEINAETAYQIGVGAAEVLGATDFILVQDTRDFNPELAEAITEGLQVGGMNVYSAGILPTPAGAILAHILSERLGRPVAAISLSASHNKATDAGIKVFGVGGLKLDDEMTERVAAAANATGPRVQPPEAHRQAISAEELQEMYMSHLLNTVSPELRESRFLSGMRIVFDGANGAAYKSGRRVLELLGADLRAINCDPSGEINKDCGATHIEAMIRTALELEADYAWAADGDADRALAYVRGRVLDGDDSLAIAAALAAQTGEPLEGAVATLYSNLGLGRRMTELSVPYLEAANGDRYVAAAMEKYGYPLGGERSGHTLYARVARRIGVVLTGDGTVTALQHLQAAAQIGKPLAEISNWEKLPHELLNVKLPKGFSPKAIANHPVIKRALQQVRETYGDDVEPKALPSGTEPVLRVLIRGGVSQEAAEAAAKDVEANALELVNA